MFSPVVVPQIIFEGLVEIKNRKISMINILFVMNESIRLGYIETAIWIDGNVKKYIEGLTKGFVCELVKVV